MAQDEQTSFDLDPAKNDFLFFDRDRVRFAILVLASLLALMIWLSAQMLDPNWSPGYVHSKGAWIFLLLTLMPVAVRVTLLAVTVGWLAERGYRTVIRSFDSKPDFAIGVSGIADLNPWALRVIWWDELIEIRRISARSKSAYLQFVALRPRPEWISTELWDRLPATFTERRIDIAPRDVGMDDEGVSRLVERYSGRTAITERAT